MTNLFSTCDDSYECHTESVKVTSVELAFRQKYHLSEKRNYKLVKEFCLLEDNFVYVFIDSDNNDLFISAHKDLNKVEWHEVVLMTTYEYNQELMNNIFINIHAARLKYNAATDLYSDKLYYQRALKTRGSQRKLWQYILKLLPAQMTKLYRMGIPTVHMARALKCNSIQEVKMNVLNMKDMHEKLMGMPPTWHKIANAAHLLFSTELINKLKPLQIVKLLKFRKAVPALVDAMIPDIISGKLNPADAIKALSYLNMQKPHSNNMYLRVDSLFKNFGWSEYTYYPNRPGLLMYKYLYTFIHRKGSPNCTASYDLLLPYQ